LIDGGKSITKGGFEVVLQRRNMINKLSTLDKGETRDRRNMQQARMGKLFF